ERLGAPPRVRAATWPEPVLGSPRRLRDRRACPRARDVPPGRLGARVRPVRGARPLHGVRSSRGRPPVPAGHAPPLALLQGGLAILQGLVRHARGPPWRAAARPRQPWWPGPRARAPTRPRPACVRPRRGPLAPHGGRPARPKDRAAPPRGPAWPPRDRPARPPARPVPARA